MDDRLSESYGIDRRSFLCASAAGAATLALGLWRLHPASAAATAPAVSAPVLSYDDWRDVYREQAAGASTRWSIHSAWRDDVLMLQQQRGQPLMYMAPQDAEARGIRDGDRARAFNDLGAFIAMVKVAPSVRPGQLVVYHAWENYQFVDGKGFQSMIPTPLNPVELAGGQFHLRPMTICMQPSHTDRDTRVEVMSL